MVFVWIISGIIWNVLFIFSPPVVLSSRPDKWTFEKNVATNPWNHITNYIGSIGVLKQQKQHSVVQDVWLGIVVEFGRV